MEASAGSPVCDSPAGTPRDVIKSSPVCVLCPQEVRHLAYIRPAPREWEGRGLGRTVVLMPAWLARRRIGMAAPTLALHCQLQSLREREKENGDQGRGPL